MEGLKGFHWCFIAISSMAFFMMSVMPIYGQISTACSISMISSFTPCLSYITGSSANGSSPTSDCCRSLSSLLSGSMDCACLMVTGNVPIRLPINRTLAVSLPSACNMPGVPLQCKAAGSPLPAPGTTTPAPGPVAAGPTLAPTAALSPSPIASVIPESTSAPDLSPQPETPTGLPPASPPVNSNTQANTGIRPVLTPSAAIPSHSFSPSLLLFVIGVVALKYH